MNSRDKLKLEIMEALRGTPRSIYELANLVGDLTVRVSQIARALDELTKDGYLIEKRDSSTVGTTYEHATPSSLSDLSARLLPHRDPVREAHAYEATQERSRSFRFTRDEGADLGSDD